MDFEGRGLRGLPPAELRVAGQLEAAEGRVDDEAEEGRR